MRSAQTSYKLYISPSLEYAPQVLRAAIEVMVEERALKFKIACTARDLLRPDKMVVYTHSPTTLRRLGTQLERALAGIEPQGVPFSAPISSGMLVSWGIDPPRLSSHPSGGDQASWRLWITRRLAQYLIAAASQRDPTEEPSMQPWEFAVARLTLDGVDVSRWVPRKFWAAWTDL